MIILYHIVLNDIDYIKKCQVCGKYFFSDKNITLYCNGKYSEDITCKEYGIKTMVSLNPIMIDGTGMCGGCRVTVGGKIKYACDEGPDFDGHEVDFDEIMNRNASYKEEEHSCKMTS